MVEREMKVQELEDCFSWFGGAVEMYAKPWWGLLEIALHTSNCSPGKSSDGRSKLGNQSLRYMDS